MITCSISEKTHITTHLDDQVDAPSSRDCIEYRQLARLVEFAVLHFRQMHAAIQFLPN